MTTATLPEVMTPPPIRLGGELLPAIIRSLPPGHRACVAPVTWSDYLAATEYRDRERPAVLIQYDRGEVELMTTSRMHEVWKTTLAGLILCVAEEFGLPLAPCGQMTVRREDLERGFEPDDCYYVRNAARVLPPRELNFATDPPPDLVLEIEHTRSATDRVGICAAFRVSKVWLYDGTTFTVLHLTAGAYQPATASLSFPRLPITEFARQLQSATAVDLTTAVRGLRAWLRSLPTE